MRHETDKKQINFYFMVLEIDMRKMFFRYLAVIMLIAMIFIIILNNYITGMIGEKYIEQQAKGTIYQVIEKIKSSETETEELKARLSEDYLTRCRAFLYMAESNPEILTDTDELKRITELLNVDELHVIGRDGKIINSSVDRYIGFDMSSDPQSAEFLGLFEEGSSGKLVQDIMPNGVEGREFQYVGLVMSDREHILQIGMKPERYIQELKKSNLSNYIENSAEKNSSIFIINKQTGRYDNHSDRSLVGALTSEVPDLDLFYEKYSSGGMYTYLDVKYYLYVSEYEDKLIGVSYDYASIMMLMQNMRILTIVFVCLTFLIIMLLIGMLVDRRIVKHIHSIISDMDDISGGDLDKTVNENSLPEFEKLSSGINHMKNAIISNGSKIAGIIGAANIPIAVYEINYRTGECSVIGNIQKIFRLTDEENRRLLSDNKALTDYICDVSSCPEDGEENVYCLPGKNCWVKIDEIPGENGIFCVVTDATDFIAEKRRIVSERDCDALTGIYNRRCFERKVSMMMKAKTDGVSAILMMDLDNFKGINDSYGHAFGDEYLKFTADCLKTFEDENIIVGRRSGDEFYMFFCGFESRKRINEIIGSIYRFIDSNLIKAPDGMRKIAFSSGAAFRSNDEDFNQLLNNADEMLYKAKNENKGGFVSE
ncbi:MAG: diguanylate cyclase domain-containing protein [Oscillospiraceae bacterium]